MNDYLIFFGVGVIVGGVMTVQGALMLVKAKKWTAEKEPRNG